jgi:hypothetical protein
VVSGVLGRASEDLALMVLEHTSVCLADDALLDIGRRASLGEEGDFEKHAACEIHTLEQLQVDVHMERELSLTLKSLLFWRNLAVSLNHNTLSEKLLLASATTDLLKSGLGFVDKTGSKSAESDLDEGTVEEDLAVDIEGVDGFLQMRHEHHIACLVVVVVQSEEINLAQHSAGSDDAFAVNKEVVAESIDQSCSIGSLVPRGDGRIKPFWDGLPAVLLQNLDDSGRLNKGLE